MSWSENRLSWIFRMDQCNQQRSLTVEEGGRRGISQGETWLWKKDPERRKALKLEKRGHEPRNVGGFWKLGKARKWILMLLGELWFSGSRPLSEPAFVVSHWVWRQACRSFPRCHFPSVSHPPFWTKTSLNSMVSCTAVKKTKPGNLRFCDLANVPVEAVFGSGEGEREREGRKIVEP